MRELYALISEEGIQLDQEQYTEYLSTRPSIEHLKNVIDAGDGQRTAKTLKFSEMLQDDIQALLQHASQLKNQSFDPTLADASTDPASALKMIATLHDTLKGLLDTGKQYTDWQMQFELNDPTDYDEPEQSLQEMGMKRKLWQNIVDVQEAATTWCDTPFSEVDAAVIEQRVSQFGRVVYQVTQALPNNEAISLLSAHVERWSLVIPILIYLKNDALLPCHWEEMSQISSLDLYAMLHEEVFTVHQFEQLELHKFHDEIERVSVSATQEQALEEQLVKVAETWETVEFIALDHKPEVYKDVYILGGVDYVYAALEETQMQVTTILGSRYVARLRERVDEWDRRLRRLNDTVEAWVDCQCQWMYLESIFTSPDIMSKLPTESKLFAGIDKSWRETMRKVKHNPLAIGIGTRPGLLEMFVKQNEQLDVIQKNLEKYLEQKRVLFPRCLLRFNA